MEMKHKVIGKWKLTSVNGKRRLERIDSHDIRGVYDAIDFGELYEDEAVIKQQKEMAFLQVLDRDGNLSGSVTIYLNGKPYYTIEELREAMQKIDKNAGNEFKKVCGQVFKAGKLSKRIDVCCSGSVDDYRFYYAEFGENETFFNVISLGSSPFDLIQKEPGSKWQFRDINGNLSDKPTKLGYQLFQAHLDHVSSIIKDKNGSYLTNLRMLDMLELLEFQTKIMDYYAKDIQKTAGYHNSMLDLSDKLILLKQVSLNKYQYDENEKEISELDARFMYAQKRFILKLLNNLPEEDENEAENEDLVNEDKFYAVEDINYNIEKVQKEKNGPWQVRYPHIDLSEEFYFIRPFKYGYAFVEKEQKGHKQFLDLNGMLSEEFYSIGEYFEGYAVVQKKKGGPKQFRDINGNLSDDKYYFTGAYFDGYAKVRQEKNGSWRFRDLMGRVSEDEYYSVPENYMSGYVRVQKEKDGPWQFRDMLGNLTEDGVTTEIGDAAYAYFKSVFTAESFGKDGVAWSIQAPTKAELEHTIHNASKNTKFFQWAKDIVEYDKNVKGAVLKSASKMIEKLELISTDENEIAAQANTVVDIINENEIKLASQQDVLTEQAEQTEQAHQMEQPKTMQVEEYVPQAQEPKEAEVEKTEQDIWGLFESGKLNFEEAKMFLGDDSGFADRAFEIEKDKIMAEFRALKQKGKVTRAVADEYKQRLQDVIDMIYNSNSGNADDGPKFGE